MKFLVIGDLHYGVGNDDPWQENIRIQTMKQIFDYVDDNDISTLVFLGDVFDNQQALTHRTLELNRKTIIEPIQERNLKVITIIGNHDAKHKTTLTPNAITEVYGKIDNFHIVNSAETIDLYGTDIDFVSWICKDNELEIREFVKNSSSKYCFGHFELAGYYYYSGIQATHGDDPQFLRHYDYVGSGHYHTINGHGNVHYLGTPFTITSNDINEERGFYEFDTKDMMKPKFIPNNKIWHRRISYPLDSEIERDLNVEDFRDTRLIIELNDKEDKFFKDLENNLENVVNKLTIRNNFAIISAQRMEKNLHDNLQVEGGPIERAVERIVSNDSISDEDKRAMKLMINELYANAQSKVVD